MERKRCCPLLSVCKITTFSALLQVKPPWNNRITMIFHVFFILHPLLPCLYVRQGLSALLSTFYKSDNTWRNFVFQAFHSVTEILRDSPRNGVTERGKTIRNRVQEIWKNNYFWANIAFCCLHLAKRAQTRYPAPYRIRRAFHYFLRSGKSDRRARKSTVAQW